MTTPDTPTLRDELYAAGRPEGSPAGPMVVDIDTVMELVGPELDRLRTELHDHIDASVRSGERLMDTQEQRRALWELLKEQTRIRKSLEKEAGWLAKQCWEARQAANVAIPDTECAKTALHAVKAMNEAVAERDEARAALARLSSGDTPTPPDVTEQGWEVTVTAFELAPGQHERLFDAVSDAAHAFDDIPSVTVCADSFPAPADEPTEETP